MIAGLLIISLIAAGLAVLLELAGARLADYGTRRIVINGEKELEVEGGSPLLATLMAQEVFVPSACGGKGTCGYCKVRILEGGGPLLPTETPYLSEEEQAGSVRLSCQVKVKEDLSLEMPEEYFLIREYRVRVEAVEKLTRSLRLLQMEILDPPEGITFTPGQYLQLQVPAYELSSQPEFRAYSLASDAEDRHRAELIITKVEGGIVSTYLHDHLEVGDELVARGPFGEFHLLDSDNDILLVATGSGLAPIRSILLQMVREGIERRAMLFFGARVPEDLFFVEELKEYEKKLPNFSYVPVLSRAKPEDRWEGERGRVTDLIDRRIPDGGPVDVHICGAPPMIKACIALLEKKGIPASNIAYDKFE